jgi:D-glycero-D-manno-heptose 1,7-bisphosphate phosphatase
MESHFEPVTISFPDLRYVFLDRDGVINRKAPEGSYVWSWKDFFILPGVESAIALLNRSGRHVIVVSNQRGVALGLYTRMDVEALHRRLEIHLADFGAHVDAFYYCPHDENQCNCRKPKIGLFEQAFRDFPEASPSNSIVIGDSLCDIEAAHRLHLPSIFILGDPSTTKSGSQQAIASASLVSNSLIDVVRQYFGK